MPRESAIPIDLPSLDDLFTTQAERDEVGCEKVGVIPLYMIDPFPMTTPCATWPRAFPESACSCPRS